MEMKKYQVIGGHDYFDYKGESNSLHGAKIIAGKNKDFWESREGNWHTPKIYKREDVEIVESDGSWGYWPGVLFKVPKPWAEPIEC